MSAKVFLAAIDIVLIFGKCHQHFLFFAFFSWLLGVCCLYVVGRNFLLFLAQLAWLAFMNATGFLSLATSATSFSLYIKLSHYAIFRTCVKCTKISDNFCFWQRSHTCASKMEYCLISKLVTTCSAFLQRQVRFV